MDNVIDNSTHPTRALNPLMHPKPYVKYRKRVTFQEKYNFLFIGTIEILCVDARVN